MGTPFENYEAIDLGVRRDPDLRRSPEKYFGGALYLAVALVFIGAVFYLPGRMSYGAVVRDVMMIAFLGIIVITVARRLRSH
jgi:hypothetical protein